MMLLPKSLQKIITFFEKLPSIGPKTAKRLAFYLLRLPQKDLEEVAEHIAQLKKNTLYCDLCFNLTEDKRCAICQNKSRDRSIIVVVEDVLDLLSMEAGNQYSGLYHVLHGRIDPLNYIGPDDIFINQLIERLKIDTEASEIVLATNPDIEGEATAMYIKKKIRELPNKFRITRLAYGLPVGADLEYADYLTLKRAMEGRREF